MRICRGGRCSSRSWYVDHGVADCTEEEAVRSLLLILAACGHPASLREPTPRAAHFCFALVADRDGPHYAYACADDVDTCEAAQTRAVQFAGIAKFTIVGSCHLEGRR
jgi:hypothetical protein